MSTMVNVEARVLGRRTRNLESRSLTLEELTDSVTLGELIATVVRAEVKAFEQRRDDQRLVRFLTEAEIVAATETGKVSMGGYIDDDHAAAVRPIDVDAAVHAALLAHTDGLFQVIIDGSPVDDQAAVVEVTEGASLMFLRLVALAGG